MNKNRPQGNHKHLNISNRIEIEKGLINEESFRSIAEKIGKDPSSISKEVRRHSKVVERNSKSFSPIPCALNKDSKHFRGNACKLKNVCGDTECNRICVTCHKYRCSEVCKLYMPQECEKLKKPPYVCNGCGKRGGCLMEQKIYSSKYAQDCYEEQLVSSREGINQTPESIQKMDNILTPLIQKGQSIAHIYATHAEELGCSRRTTYSYINNGVFKVRNIDLRRKVKYKKRKKSTQTSLKDREFRKNRTYKDFCKFLENEAPACVVEMDTVEGKKGTKPCFLTMLFRNCNLMLIFLLKAQEQLEVIRVFDYLTEHLGVSLFNKLFGTILTDNGSEFQAVECLEKTQNGEKRCSIYYCDPYRSNQKGALEKNHEYIRYILPKGTSFEGISEDKVRLITNHINSEKRDSLNGHSPFELSQILLDNKLHKTLGLEKIEPDDVNLTSKLLK